MTQTSTSDGTVATGQAACLSHDALDSIQVIEREFGRFVMNQNRYKHQVPGSDRLDRMALMVLGTLAFRGPSRLTAIAESTGFDPSTVSRQVADLEKAGLLQRDADPEDRRALVLQTTDQGQQLMARLAEGRRKRLERMLADWSASDIESFGRLLGKFNEATGKYGAQNASEIEQELNHG